MSSRQVTVLLLVSTLGGALVACLADDAPPAQPEIAASWPTARRAPLRGLWIAAEEIARLPTKGPAWKALTRFAAKEVRAPRLSDKDDKVDALVLAKALVATRLGDRSLADEARAICLAAMGTEKGGKALALGRNLPGYVIAAELVGFARPEDERRFRSWLRSLLDLPLRGGSLRRVHERRPNNWGTHAGGARAVVARYLGDERELARVARVFLTWLGASPAGAASHRGFEFQAGGWEVPRAGRGPSGINPRSATIEGHSVDGVLPDDQRRGGPFRWPPPKENYVYEALQGALLQAEVLDRAGYEVWEAGDRALLRAFRWLHEVAKFPAEGDDTWQPHVINFHYRTSFPAPVPSRPGKNLGFTDWTFGPGRRPAPPLARPERPLPPEAPEPRDS